MADGIQSVMKGINNVQHEMNQVVYRQNRAAMYAVREAGRKVKQAGKRHAPVDSGTLKASIRSLKRLKGNATVGWTNMVGPMPSIKHGTMAKKSGRQITDVIKYRRKEEAKSHFMAAAHSEVTPMMREIFEQAVVRALRTASRHG